MSPSPPPCLLLQAKDPDLILDVPVDEIFDGHEGLGPLLVSVARAQLHRDGAAASHLPDVIHTAAKQRGNPLFLLLLLLLFLGAPVPKRSLTPPLHGTSSAGGRCWVLNLEAPLPRMAGVFLCQHRRGQKGALLFAEGWESAPPPHNASGPSTGTGLSTSEPFRDPPGCWGIYSSTKRAAAGSHLHFLIHGQWSTMPSKIRGFCGIR